MREHRRSMAMALVAAVLILVVAATSSMPLEDIARSMSNGNLHRDEEDSSYRLSDEILPTHYAIKIEPEFVNGKAEMFHGEVEITAVVQSEDIQSITLHKSPDVNVTEIIVTVNEDNGLYQSDSDNIDKEFLIIHLKNVVPSNSDISIKVTYESDFPDGMYGFYKSTFTVTSEDENSEEELLTTQFQPTHARKAFPCFDEPRFKAEFQVTLVVPNGYNALSNTKIGKIDNNTETNQSDITFETTPIMSTYLLAFIIYKEDTFAGTIHADDDLPFRTWGRRSEIEAGAGNLSQIDGPQIIKHLANYTNINYIDYADKIDQAAIPDFSFGAMENWGLVTYRETALLYDEKEHTQSAKRRVSEIIAHELTHQWFGNLVTTEWWSTAWLNEGFATYFEYYITDKVHPLWRMMERLVIDEQLAALSVDASLNGTALTEDSVNDPDQVLNHFGTITYSKGGSVIRMFSNILGDEKFEAGLQNYLAENAQKAVTPAILFEALTRNTDDIDIPSGADLSSIFESWTNSSGFPVITVKRIVNDENNGASISLTQEQFLEDGTSSDNKYNVRVTLISNEKNYNSQVKWILAADENAIITNVPESENWLLVLTDGYFRVTYDDNNWNLLIEELQTNLDETDIEPVERAMLIDNAFNLARTKKLNYSTAIELVSYLEKELDYIPWSVAFSGLNYLHRMLIGEDDTIDKFLLHITKSVYDELDFIIVEDNDDAKHIEHVHRANVLNWACRAGHPECITSAVENLRNYTREEDSVKVAPNLRSVVYCYGVKHEDILWTKLWKKLDETDDAAERSLLISALGCSKVSSTLYMYLETTVFGGAVRTQDIASVFSAVYSNPDGLDVALLFLESNLRRIEARMITTMNGLSNIIRGIAQYINNKEQMEQLRGISERLSNSEHQLVARNGVATAEVNLRWLEENKGSVLTAIENVLSSAGATTDSQVTDSEATDSETDSETTPDVETTTKGASGIRPALLALAVSFALPALMLAF